MLLSIGISITLTGGCAWWRMCVMRRYTGQNFDAEFIQTMYQVCRHYIGERQSVSLEDMGDYVREKVPNLVLVLISPPARINPKWCYYPCSAQCKELESRSKSQCGSSPRGKSNTAIDSTVQLRLCCVSWLHALPLSSLPLAGRGGRTHPRSARPAMGA